MSELLARQKLFRAIWTAKCDLEVGPLKYGLLTRGSALLAICFFFALAHRIIENEENFDTTSQIPMK